MESDPYCYSKAASLVRTRLRQASYPWVMGSEGEVTIDRSHIKEDGRRMDGSKSTWRRTVENEGAGNLGRVRRCA